MIGVDPPYQGRGYGAALLKYGLEQCDRDHAAAYLASTNPRNVPLYQRHGFEVLGKIQVGSSPPLVPMLRAPPELRQALLIGSRPTGTASIRHRSSCRRYSVLLSVPIRRITPSLEGPVDSRARKGALRWSAHTFWHPATMGRTSLPAPSRGPLLPRAQPTETATSRA